MLKQSNKFGKHFFNVSVLCFAKIYGEIKFQVTYKFELIEKRKNKIISPESLENNMVAEATTGIENTAVQEDCKKSKIYLTKNKEII